MVRTLSVKHVRQLLDAAAAWATRAGQEDEELFKVCERLAPLVAEGTHHVTFVSVDNAMYRSVKENFFKEGE